MPTERTYGGYTLEQIEKMGGDNEACIAYDLIARIRELEIALGKITCVDGDDELVCRQHEMFSIARQALGHAGGFEL